MSMNTSQDKTSVKGYWQYCHMNKCFFYMALNKFNLKVSEKYLTSRNVTSCKCFPL